MNFSNIKKIDFHSIDFEIRKGALYLVGGFLMIPTSGVFIILYFYDKLTYEQELVKDTSSKEVDKFAKGILKVGRKKLNTKY